MQLVEISSFSNMPLKQMPMNQQPNIHNNLQGKRSVAVGQLNSQILQRVQIESGPPVASFQTDLKLDQQLKKKNVPERAAQSKFNISRHCQLKWRAWHHQGHVWMGNRYSKHLKQKPHGLSDKLSSRLLAMSSYMPFPQLDKQLKSRPKNIFSANVREIVFLWVLLITPQHLQ